MIPSWKIEIISVQTVDFFSTGIIKIMPPNVARLSKFASSLLKIFPKLEVPQLWHGLIIYIQHHCGPSLHCPSRGIRRQVELSKCSYNLLCCNNIYCFWLRNLELSVRINEIVASWPIIDLPVLDSFDEEDKLLGEMWLSGRGGQKGLPWARIRIWKGSSYHFVLAQVLSEECKNPSLSHQLIRLRGQEVRLKLATWALLLVVAHSSSWKEEGLRTSQIWLRV